MKPKVTLQSGRSGTKRNVLHLTGSQEVAGSGPIGSGGRHASPPWNSIARFGGLILQEHSYTLGHLAVM